LICQVFYRLFFIYFTTGSRNDGKLLISRNYFYHNTRNVSGIERKYLRRLPPCRLSPERNHYGNELLTCD
jgi:hypothetical protein